jgi:hypothetical protein
MILRIRTKKPGEMHKWFAWHPVVIRDLEDTDNQGKPILTSTFVWLRKINRRYDRNLSGTARWVYSLPG